MFVLIRDNVEIIISDEAKKAELINAGFKEVVKSKSMSRLNLDELKALATEKSIEFDSKVTKAELIAALKGAEDE